MNRREQAYFLRRRGATLYTVEYVPDVRPERVYLLLSPLDNEANYSTRFYVRVARRLAGAGAAVFRFDYRGTGNSGGEFHEISLATIYEDIQILRDHACSTFGDLPVGLIGGRFGANIACGSAAGSEVDSIVLWDPILRPDREFRTNFVNKTLLNNKLMGGAPQSLRGIDEAIDERGCVELNGALFSGEFYRQMTSWCFGSAGIARTPSAWILFSSSLGAAERDILHSLEQTGAKVGLFGGGGHRNAWSGERFSSSMEAAFLIQASLAFAQTEMGTACRT